MDIGRLVEYLSDPAAYPEPPERVEVRQTHISVVFLAGDLVYKVKKPVDLGFLDFRSRDRRRHFCEEEVRLNRRLAPQVYLGVEPITRRAGGLRIGGEGAVLEWAVKMRRLPDEATLEQQLTRGELDPDVWPRLAERLARFHDQAAAGDDVAARGRWPVVADNARENFEQTGDHVGRTVSAEVHRRARAASERALQELRPLVEERARRGVPRDTHGDLHLDHVYWFPERSPPGDLVIIDCIEFNERFRYADPVADAAFLAMDLAWHGFRGLSRSFAEAYLRARGDREGHRLLPFYSAYRAAVRAKVDGFKSLEGEVPQDERQAALASARGHWLLVLGALEAPGKRPCVVCTAGLPGSGKSALAARLAAVADFEVIASDRVRKELAGLDPEQSAAAPFGEGIYAPDWTERTYAECCRRAAARLWEGRRVLLDAGFRDQAQRQRVADLARDYGVPLLFLECRASPDTVRRRLGGREGGTSDADWETYRRAAAAREAPAGDVAAHWRRLDNDGSPEATLDAALAALREAGLASPASR